MRGLNPSIERVILQCLEEMPSDRPESVRDVIAALPGGDPLRSAIDAGETPSPRAVAAAERIGELPLAVAWGGVVLMLLLLAAIGVGSRYTQLYRQVPLDMSPDVLTDRARQIIRAAGYESRAYGSRRWMSHDLDVLKEGTGANPSLDHARAFHRLSPLRLGYRESPQPLVPQGRGAMVTASDPPFDVPGMVTVMLDSAGKLVRFVRVPTPAQQTGTKSAAVDWDPFFEFARLGVAARLGLLGHKRFNDRRLIDLRPFDRKLNAGITQNREPRRTARRQNDLCHGVACRLCSANTAAAVSSIERRVTSMTGQPLSA